MGRADSTILRPAGGREMSMQKARVWCTYALLQNTGVSQMLQARATAVPL